MDTTTDLRSQLCLPMLQTYSFVELAVSHKSYINEAYAQDPTERSWMLVQHRRLAHLGDGIMNAAVTDYLFRQFLDADAGILTEKSKPLKERKGAVLYAHAVGISQVCFLGNGISDGDMQGDMFGEMFEALMGAIYLGSDRNFSVARDWFHAQCGAVIKQRIERSD
jgi:ribonuclease-3